MDYFQDLAMSAQRQVRSKLERGPEPRDNHILASLSPEARHRLFPHLQLVPLPLRAVLSESRRPMRHVYFPTDCIISQHYLTENGASTAISVTGNEGLLGVSFFLGGERAPSRSLVQSAGYAYRLPRCLVKAEFERQGELLLLMLRHTHALMLQTSQTALCNRYHSIDQQFCRWLLQSMDRQPLSSNLAMTQEFISSMLGVRREGITEAAVKLRRLGVISYTRGVIEVHDRSRLEALACECYTVIRKETEALLRYIPKCRARTDTVAVRTATLVTTRTVKGSRPLAAS